MLIPYIRSSSLSRYEFCPHSYFCEYNLGIRGDSNKKADKGTIVHKVLEILALLSKAKADIDDEIAGDVAFKKHDINDITTKVYKYYSSHTKHDWTKTDLADCKEWVWKVIQFNNGQFDPRKMRIQDAEQQFDIEINEPWATYEYDLKGQHFQGMLRLKGTIDLVTRPADNILEIVDWKTGRRLNWATGEEKTHAKLIDDPQLRLYHYAASKIYPWADQIFVTIFFINDGGPFSICYSKQDLPTTERMLRQKFEAVKNTDVPRLLKTWKCTKLCHYGKNTFDVPIFEFRKGQEQDVGEPMTMCAEIQYQIQKNGLQATLEKYIQPSFELNKYKEPGSV